MGTFSKTILASGNHVVMPVAVFPGAGLIGATVQDLVTDADRQFAAQKAFHEKFNTPVVMTAMDLSLEAEAFGSQIRFSEDEVPSVVGRLVVDEKSVRALSIPDVSGRCAGVAVATARKLTGLPDKPLVLGGMIGPFSLAGRLYGVSESLELTMTDPDLLHQLLAKATEFLVSYARAFREAGADGVLMAEPTAGLLSPRMLGQYSSPYIRTIIGEVEDAGFEVVLHNCAARVNHLKWILESGAKALHFGAPMDLSEALKQVPSDVVVSGNLDPSGVFCSLSAGEVFSRTRNLMKDLKTYANFVPSSGCDIPAHAPLENVAAFYNAVTGQASQ